MNQQALDFAKQQKMNDPQDDDEDEATAIDRLRRKGARGRKTAWTALPTKWKRDKKFVVAALQSFKHLPSKVEFERLFPPEFLFDREVVLAFMRRHDAAKLYKERFTLWHLRGNLADDRDVMMAVCRCIPGMLRECCLDLLDDREIVLTGVSMDGLQLQYAGLSCQDDRAIVLAACHQNGFALKYASPRLFKELTKDFELMQRIVRNKGGVLLYNAPDSFQSNREMAIEAVCNGLPLHQCHHSFKDDIEFLKACVGWNPSCYLEIGVKQQSLPALALAAIERADENSSDVFEMAVALVPSLLQERSVVVRVVKLGEARFVQSLFVKRQLPQDTYHDHDIMVDAMKKKVPFSFVQGDLRADPDFLRNAIVNATSAFDILRGLDMGVKERFPDMVVLAISRLSPELIVGSANLHALTGHAQQVLGPMIPMGLFGNRDVVLAWIRQGFGFWWLERSIIFLPELLSDEEIALALARFSPDAFGNVDEDLRGNLDLMLRAVAHTGTLVQYAMPGIKDNINLALTAVAQTLKALTMVDADALTKHIKNRFEAYEAFMVFLSGFDVLLHSSSNMKVNASDVEGGDCETTCKPQPPSLQEEHGGVVDQELPATLRVANKDIQSHMSPIRGGDYHTRRGLGELVAAYMDYPRREELQKLRAAQKAMNLSVNNRNVSQRVGD